MDSDTGLSIAGIGVGVIVTLLAAGQMRPMVRGALFSFGGLLIVVGVWGMFGGSLAKDKNPSATVTQANPHGSPNVIGNNNQFTINQGGGNVSAPLRYVTVSKEGKIESQEGFGEYKMQVQRKDIAGEPTRSLGQTEYVLTFDKVPESLDIRTQDGLAIKVVPIPDRPNARVVRCMGPGFGGESARECSFTVWALK